MKWNTQEKISSYVKVHCFNLRIYQPIENKDTWFMSCPGIFDNLKLGEMGLNEAQIMAGAKLQLEIEKAHKIVTNQ